MPVQLDHKLVQHHAPLILQLPDEILSHIVELAADVKPLHIGLDVETTTRLGGALKTIHTGVALSRVCRRLNRIVTPLLFTYVLAYHGYKSPLFLKQLHRSFKHNASIRPYCKSLSIVYEEQELVGEEHLPRAEDNNNTLDTLSLLEDILSWLTSTMMLSIHCYKFLDIEYILSRKMKSLSDLTTLRITGTAEFLHIYQAIRSLGPNAALRTLDLCAYDLEWEDEDVLRQELTAMAGTAPFTRLLLCSWSENEYHLALFLAWPKQLNRLALHIQQGWFAPNDTLIGKIQPALETQKAHLTHIRIGGDYRPGLEGYDFREFASLESLSLSAASTHGDPELVYRLLAPHLRSFHWSLPFEFSHDSSVAEWFEERHEKWLRNLMSFAVARDRSELKYVDLQAELKTESVSHVGARQSTRDIERIHAITQEFRARDITFRHGPPPEKPTGLQDSCFGPTEETWLWQHLFLG